MPAALTRLLVCCVLLRALVPVGFMPDLAAGDGVFTIVICTADGFSTIDVDANGDPIGPDHEPDGEAKDHCPFAPIGSIVLTATPPDPLPPVLVAAGPSWSSIEAACRLRHHPTSRQPRAPPALS